MSLPRGLSSSMADFVQCDRLLQKAYSPHLSSSRTVAHKVAIRPMPITGENFIAIGQEKKTLLRRSKNIGMASEKLYRNTLSNDVEHLGMAGRILRAQPGTKSKPSEGFWSLLFCNFIRFLWRKNSSDNVPPSSGKYAHGLELRFTYSVCTCKLKIKLLVEVEYHDGPLR